MAKNNRFSFLIDWDGTLFLGQNLVRGAVDFYTFMVQLNARIIYLTNNSSLNSLEYENILRKHKLWNVNCQIITSGMVAGWFISNVLKINKIFVIGTDSLIKELEKFGIENSYNAAELVLLGFDKTINYDKIQKGHELICKGLPFYATHDDKVCPDENKTYVDCGSLIEMFKTSTNIKPTIIGKPYKIIQKYLLGNCNLNLNYTFLLGDRKETDGKLAKNLGVTFYQIDATEISTFKYIQNEITKLKNSE